MRRVTVVGVAVALVLLSDATGARQSTLPGEASEVSSGITFALLGVGTAEELPMAPADLVLSRLTLEPGFVLLLDPADPSVALLYVESGTLTLRAEELLTVRREAVPATAVAGGGEAEEPVREPVAAGTEVILDPGDSVVVPCRTTGEARNEGTGPVVLLITEVAPRQSDATPLT